MLLRGAFVATALVLGVPGGARAQLAPAPDAAGQQAATLLIVGQDGQATALSAAELDGMPAATVDLPREHGGEARTAYAGPPLWAALDRAGALG